MIMKTNLHFLTKGTKMSNVLSGCYLSRMNLPTRVLYLDLELINYINILLPVASDLIAAPPLQSCRFVGEVTIRLLCL